MNVLVACEYSGRVSEMDIDVRQIPHFDGYLVCRDGYVLSCRTTRGVRPLYRRLHTSVDKKGYPGLTLCQGSDVRWKVRIHKLVALLFVPNRDQHPCVRHRDGNPLNCNADNLTWGTYVDNEQDKKRHGTYDLRRTGKLSSKDREEVRRLWESGWSQVELANLMGVSRPTITRFLNSTTWSGMQCES